MRDIRRGRERERKRQRHRQRQKQAPCREPDMGHDPGTPGSCPRLKVDAQPLSHQGGFFFLRFYLFIHERHRGRAREAET